jgi:hypothetical protein
VLSATVTRCSEETEDQGWILKPPTPHAGARANQNLRVKSAVRFGVRVVGLRSPREGDDSMVPQFSVGARVRDCREGPPGSDSDGGVHGSISRRPGPRVNDRSNTRVERATVNPDPRVRDRTHARVALLGRATSGDLGP